MNGAFTVGILFPGEMGTSVGRLLAARGHRVVTTLAGRSERTSRLCRAAELTVLDSVGEVVSRSDVLISLVPPAAAVAVAERVAAEAPEREQPAIYVDANSVSPVTIQRLGAVLQRSNFILVDAAIHGLAPRLTTDATVYLSGPRASEVAAMFGRPPRTVVLGDQVGRASLLKMLLGGTSKGIVALLLELSDLALHDGVLDEFWAECRRWYPGIMEPFERLLPTYSQHIERRTQEIGELELTLSAATREPTMARATRALFARTAKSPRTLLALVERMSASADRQRGLP